MFLILQSEEPSLQYHQVRSRLLSSERPRPFASCRVEEKHALLGNACESWTPFRFARPFPHRVPLYSGTPGFRRISSRRRRIHASTSASSKRQYFPRRNPGMRSGHLSRVCPYTQEGGTCRRSATSWTLRSRPFSALSPPVAAFAALVRDGSHIEIAPDMCGELSSPFGSRDTPFDSNRNEFASRREACRLEDAVFSRTPNWVGRGFMVATRS